MKCICGKELTGRQKHCSTACRMKASRSRSVTESPASVTRIAKTEAPSVTENDKDVTVEVASVTEQQSVTDNDPCETIIPDNPCQYLGANIHKDRDHHQSITYDVSEEGFRRRNKHWDTHAESYRKTIREGAIRRKQERIEQVQAVQARRAAIKYQEA